MTTTGREKTGFKESAENHTARFERTAARESLRYHEALAIGQSSPSTQTAEDDFKDAGANI